MVIRKRMRIAAAVLVMCTMAGCSLFPDGTRVVEKDAGESMQQIDYNSDHIKSTVSDVLEIDADVYRTDKEFKSYTIDYSGVESMDISVSFLLEIYEDCIYGTYCIYFL